jgi:hypothetical protein
MSLIGFSVLLVYTAIYRWSLQAAEKLMSYIRPRLQRLREDSKKVPKGQLNSAQDAILGLLMEDD